MQRGCAWLLATVAAIGSFGACGDASEEAKVKRTPALPPPTEVGIPAALSIAVTVDGAAAPAITAERLGAEPADYTSPEHRAWRLTRLVPALDQPGATIEARGPTGVSIRLDRPVDAAAMQPVLFLTRRGDVVVALVDPKDPFPDYHGQGGRLRRPGDPLPRLSPVTTLAVSR
jgi:hypothetical protein